MHSGNGQIDVDLAQLYNPLSHLGREIFFLFRLRISLYIYVHTHGRLYLHFVFQISQVSSALLKTIHIQSLDHVEQRRRSATRQIGRTSRTVHEPLEKP